MIPKRLDEKQAIVKVQRMLDAFLSKSTHMDVLEAGCGSISKLRISGRITGIDISMKQLERNNYIDNKIVGDIQTHDLGFGTFDLIVCWDVLEHLPYPEKAIMNFLRAIKHGGLIILHAPLPESVYGIVTKATSLWFHEFVYNKLLGMRLDIKDDEGPFKTYYSNGMKPLEILKAASLFQVECEAYIRYEGGNQVILRRNKVINIGLSILERIYSMLSKNSKTSGSPIDSSFVLMLRKKQESIN